MTSNLGTAEAGKEGVGFLAQSSLQDDQSRKKSAIDDALKREFRPEFLNRIDDIIIFDSLTAGQIGDIVDLMVADVANRLSEHGVSIKLTDAARDWLGSEGFDSIYGARPLRRVIQRHLENDLSRQILAGEISDGDLVTVDSAGDGLIFQVDSATGAETPEIAKKTSEVVGPA